MRAFYENKQADLYCRDSSNSKKTLGYTSHLHYHIELALVKSGKTVVTIDSTEYTVEGGDIVVVFPNQIHRFETVEREKYVLMIVNPDLISEYLKQFTGSIPVSNVIKGGANDSELYLLAHKISSTFNSSSEYSDAITRGYLLAFFGRLLQKIELKEVQTKESNVLGVILNYCINNSSRHLSLDLLEKELHISKYYISHTLSSKLHMGFNDYINSIRVSNACKYLTKSDRSVTEISDLVGFNTMRTFNRAFQKQMGMTPSEYRAKK